jgi:hypothetical protein
MPDHPTADQVDAFVARWQAAQAAELANAQSFLIELCTLLGVPGPEPATKDPARDGYVFERPVDFQDAADAGSGRIDLYKRGCFVLETKQGVDAENARREKGTGRARSSGHGRRGSAAWDRTMGAAKRQAERYARNLDIEDHEEPVPPLVVACDVGYCLDLYANFGHPQRYVPFPDNQTYRIALADLHWPEIRERLRLTWTTPDALNPARRQAAVTRELAATLAELAASLEAGGALADDVFGFLSRCLFTMFAEDARLIPERSFSGLLKEYRDHLEVLPDALEDLWRTMNSGGFSAALKAKLRRFNGGLFADTRALPLDAAQLDLLRAAAAADWREVEPAIFGTLLERALDASERHKLGAHYTPRAYVERLVFPAVIDPLREEWEATQAAVAQIEADAALAEPQGIKAREQHDRRTRKTVLAELRRYLARLTSVRILDPACGSGNFLYVTLEHLKRIEGEVQAALGRYGVSSLDLQGVAVTPAQLLGIGVNPRAAAIADLVLWIGYLQWHLRTHDGPQGLSDPVLKAYGNIEQRDAVLAYDAKTPRLDAGGRPVTIWDGRTTKPHPTTGKEVPDSSARVPLFDYANAKPADWPEAEFIVGNPPFVGMKRMQAVLGEGYADALRSAYHGVVPDSADYVMYWWHRAAEAVREGRAESFGLITTNSITQTFNRRVVETQLGAEPPLSVTFAVPDHPWVDSADGAAVRVAMTVGERGQSEGVLASVVSETGGGPAGAEVDFSFVRGPINADLTVGADVSAVEPLKANEDISFWGVKFYGSGFILTGEEREGLFAGTPSYEIVRPYVGGRDLTGKPRNRYVIDADTLTVDELRDRYPEAYAHLLDHVKPVRDENPRKQKRDYWWVLGENQPAMRRAVAGLDRYVVTTETAKHRTFRFVHAPTLAEGTVAVFATDDAYHLGVLSSRIHVVWSLAAGGRLGIGNDPRYNNTRTFKPFPFPDASEGQRETIRQLAERLEAHRERVLSDALTLTNLYNAVEKVRAGEPLTKAEQKIHQSAQVALLVETHDALDAAVAEAYGWPVVLSDQEILVRLVVLNTERRAEEAAGLVRYLRPAFQAPGETTQAEIDLVPPDAEAPRTEPEAWPPGTAARALAIRRVLREAGRPMSVESVAQRFKRAPRAAVADLLDTLATLGQARHVDAGYAV